jgi:hypothetical protein
MKSVIVAHKITEVELEPIVNSPYFFFRRGTLCRAY